jgi:hypothetical protein
MNTALAVRPPDTYLVYPAAPESITPSNWHRDLLEQLHAAEAHPPGAPAAGHAVSRASCKLTCSPPKNAQRGAAGEPGRVFEYCLI